MYQYPPDAFYKVSALLERSAFSLGATAVTMQGVAYPLHLAMDEAGVLAWALVHHAAAIVSISGIPQPVPGNILPFSCVPDDEAPLGHKVVIQPSTISLGMGYRFLDAALEHCICVAMRELGYTPSEWMALPENQRAVPVEPYLYDLSQNWITDTLERGTAADVLNNWPELLDQLNLPHQMANSHTQGENHDAQLPFRIPSAR